MVDRLDLEEMYNGREMALILQNKVVVHSNRAHWATQDLTFCPVQSRFPQEHWSLWQPRLLMASCVVLLPLHCSLLTLCGSFSYPHVPEEKLSLRDIQLLLSHLQLASGRARTHILFQS